MRDTTILKHRDSVIDIAKGIGIFLVVFGHVPLPMDLITPIYLFHMPLFFFLSGMFFHPEEKFLYGVYKKIRTLIIPYFFFALVGNGTTILRDYIVYRTIEMDTFGALFDGSSSPLWFLICLFFCYVISKLISQISQKWMYILLFSMIVGIVGCRLVSQDVKIPLGGGRALLMQFYFIVGYVVRNVPFKGQTVYERILKVNRVIAWSALIGFIMCCFPFDVRPNVSTLDFYHPLLFVIGSLLGIFLTMKFSKELSVNGRGITNLIQQMGNQSLFILGFHFYVIFHLYFFAIPALIRIFSYFSFEIEGSYLRSSYWLGTLFVIPSIFVSMVLGNYCMKYVKFLFRS